MTVQSELRRVGEIDVLRVTGDLDRLTAHTLPAVLPDPLGTPLVLDLSGVPFVDSSGVRAVDAVARACGAAGVPLRIVAPEGGGARYALEICAFPTELLASRIEDALTALR